MGLTRATVFILSLSILYGVSENPAVAQEPPQKPAEASYSYINVAVIDIDEIRRKASVVKDIRAQIGKFRNAFQADIQKEEEVLRNADKELARKRTILSPDAFAEERRKFQQSVVEVQRLVQKRKQELDSAMANAMRKVELTLTDIVTDMAKKKKLTLILRKEQTVLAAPSLSITKEVLRLVEEKMPSLKIPDIGK
ncbi:MAG: OmpH family outer membrane protein [Rhodospirillales bacterium]|jgi:Skp family chaperone for outer membrane proteins|nr:OmpH family outer membrane protein [Rhodospirillales bacterium]HIJ42477.1 OmpH family outer membrane protein [Rhodospirillaceae bacterium]MDP7098108.1 OmpH family outer membrane protein [Rhodospirillales bacterium]MDP7216082.1 OmpH family outer membrane protein [Rhodospirillales bacterium]HIJ44687.1 OmpH family outer membrane protein [Rhodospirillaceae bacterium]